MGHSNLYIGNLTKGNRLWVQAVMVLLVLFLFASCSSEEKEEYNSAVKLLEEKKYDEAIEAFEDLGEYKDSNEMILKAKYAKGCDLLDNSEYVLARELFSEIKEYEDSEEKYNQATDAIGEIEVLYADVKDLVEAGNIPEAIKKLDDASVYSQEMYDLANFCNKVNPYIGSFKLQEGNAPIKSSESSARETLKTKLSNINLSDKSVVPHLYLDSLILLYQSEKGNFGYEKRYKQGDYEFTNNNDVFKLILVAKDGEKRESLYNRTDTYSTIDLSTKKVMQEAKTDSGDSDTNEEKKKDSFTNKYGTPTTKCAHSGCNEYIAPSGDTNCCVKHSNKCADCGKYIDEDAMYCMDCLEKAAKGGEKSEDPGYKEGSEWENYDKDGSGTISQDEYQDSVGDYLKQFGFD